MSGLIGAFIGQIMLPLGKTVLEQVTDGDRPLLRLGDEGGKS